MGVWDPLFYSKHHEEERKAQWIKKKEMACKATKKTQLQNTQFSINKIHLKAKQLKNFISYHNNVENVINFIYSGLTNV